MPPSTLTNRLVPLPIVRCLVFDFAIDMHQMQYDAVKKGHFERYTGSSVGSVGVGMWVTISRHLYILERFRLLEVVYPKNQCNEK